jgi:formate hydrogenlyase transcriptional activator
MTNCDGRELIGSTEEFRSILKKVALVAPSDCSVLIRGETGTGKELVARAIHKQSRRPRGPFVTLNCAAIPAGLLESELFGHERGAFTGALTPRIGRLQAANGGTLFLDEIGDLPVELQPKLLRALQEHEFERLGSSQTIRVDVRIVAATNQNLEQMVNDRQFRADLYYRLNVFPLMLPPLRERSADIPLLASHFVQHFAARMNKRIERIPQGVIDTLSRHNWPGNVRELQNCIERAVLMSEGEVLCQPCLEIAHTGRTYAESNRTLEDVERLHIAETLRETAWVVGGLGGAAVRLGLPRTTLLSRMQKLGITRETARVRAYAACGV